MSKELTFLTAQSLANSMDDWSCVEVAIIKQLDDWSCIETM